MLTKLIDIWDVVYHLCRDFFTLLEFAVRILFIPGILPFTVLGIIGILVKVRSRRT